jgi:hypothetical protein
MRVQKIWSDARRRIIAKTVFDIFKIEVAAIFASKFFADFSLHVKVLIVLVMLSTALGGLLMYPPEGD